MRYILVLAVALSVLVHALALFGIDFGMFGEPPETQPLLAELRSPPPAPARPAPAPPPPAAPPPAAPENPPPLPETPPASVVPPLVPPSGAAEEALTPGELLPPEVTSAPHPPAPAAPPPAAPVLAGSGRLAFVVVKDSLGMQIGRAEHRWDFPGDGTYRLQALIETSGLAALIKPLRQEHESRGRLGPGGLQPESFRILRNGVSRGEDADFDWETRQVRLQRDGSVQSVASGSQDLLSLNYQLAYLAAPENGSTIGVVTGRKYQPYSLDAFGEETIETPAGSFRTLHLRAAGDTISEIWIALDRWRLPVKIRFTDKKGDSYELRATEIDITEAEPQ
ncbi:DUF3108 domain-containing protein [Azonexus sp.]|uniref:DUF3108 domain-containing protein n=1 Tax=Azonexus sp. TaxID=1872668 RepID=UPI0035B23161